MRQFQMLLDALATDVTNIKIVDAVQCDVDICLNEIY
jgi:hypothetical protein